MRAQLCAVSRTPPAKLRAPKASPQQCAPTWPDLSPIPESALQTFCASLADLQAEAAKDSPNAQFHVSQPSEKLFARNQQRPDLLRSNRFGVHRLEPSHPQQQLGNPTR